MLMGLRAVAGFKRKASVVHASVVVFMKRAIVGLTCRARICFANTLFAVRRVPDRASIVFYTVFPREMGEMGRGRKGAKEGRQVVSRKKIFKSAQATSIFASSLHFS